MGKGRENVLHQHSPPPLVETGARMHLSRMTRSEMRICMRRCGSLRRMRLWACARDTDYRAVVGGQSVLGCSTPRSLPSSGVGMPLQPQPQLQIERQLQPGNLDNEKRHKLDKKITEEGLRTRSSEGGVEAVSEEAGEGEED